MHLEGGKGRKGDDLAPILPFLILDLFYGYYCKGIAKRSFTHKSKSLARQMGEAYNRVNKKFFAAFSPDEWDEVIGIMDSMEDYVKNDVLIAETGVWNVFKTYADTDYLVCLYMCNMLAKAAQTVWMIVYHNYRTTKFVGHSGKVMSMRTTVPTQNKDIDTLLFTTKRMAELAIGGTVVDAKDENKVKNLLDASDILGRKFVRFIMEDGK